MSRNDNDELLAAFKLPFRYKALMWVVVFVIVAAGTLVSVLLKDFMWLGRFGALIVIAAMMLAASGIPNRITTRILAIAQEVTREVVRMQVKRLPHLYGLSGNETADEVSARAEKELRQRLATVGALAEKTAERDLQRTEFLVASFGTLLWAFADLIGKW